MYDTSTDNLKWASQSYCSCLDTSFSRDPADRSVYSSLGLFPGKPRHLPKNLIAVSVKSAALFALVS